MGIEPTAQAWEAWVLPLYDARTVRRFYAPAPQSGNPHATRLDAATTAVAK